MRIALWYTAPKLICNEPLSQFQMKIIKIYPQIIVKAGDNPDNAL